MEKDKILDPLARVYFGYKNIPLRIFIICLKNFPISYYFNGQITSITLWK